MAAILVAPLFIAYDSLNSMRAAVRGRAGAGSQRDAAARTHSHGRRRASSGGAAAGLRDRFWQVAAAGHARHDGGDHASRVVRLACRTSASRARAPRSTRRSIASMRRIPAEFDGRATRQEASAPTVCRSCCSRSCSASTRSSSRPARFCRGAPRRKSSRRTSKQAARSSSRPRRSASPSRSQASSRSG